MQIHKARSIWNLPKERIWEIPDGLMSIEFDDGTVHSVDSKATVYSWYMGVYHRLYPKTPILPRHHLGDRQIGKGTELDLLSAGLFDCKAVYRD